jgi:hypothetical protein
VKRGGPLEPESPHKKEEDARQATTLMVFYASLADIPPSPREPSSDDFEPAEVEIPFGEPSAEFRVSKYLSSKCSTNSISRNAKLESTLLVTHSCPTQPQAPTRLLICLQESNKTSLNHKDFSFSTNNRLRHSRSPSWSEHSACSANSSHHKLTRALPLEVLTCQVYLLASMPIPKLNNSPRHSHNHSHRPVFKRSLPDSSSTRPNRLRTSKASPMARTTDSSRFKVVTILRATDCSHPRLGRTMAMAMRVVTSVAPVTEMRDMTSVRKEKVDKVM